MFQVQGVSHKTQIKIALGEKPLFNGIPYLLGSEDP